jgi:hypothetical protein
MLFIIRVGGGLPKSWFFGKALDEGLITYIAYKRIKDHFMADGSWDY